MTTGSNLASNAALSAVLMIIVLSAITIPALPCFGSEVPRIEVEEARELVFSGKALLICAYEGEDKFRAMPLEGAISLDGFNQFADHVPISEKIVFYCA